jgi:predicted enzyme related to lactoylglutathione lyase
MPLLVIAVYRPKRGKSNALLHLVREHVPTLRRQGLATQREVIAGKAADGSIVEIFEWASPEAVDRAHHDPIVQRLWKKFNTVSDSVSIGNLAEAAKPFPSFEPIDLGPRIGSVDWVDCTTKSADRLKDFYQRVVGLSAMGVDMGGYSDWAMLGVNGRAACGICNAKGENARIPPGWLPYFTVASLAKSLAVARRLGATVVEGPRSGGGGLFAAIHDPSGGFAMLYQAEAPVRAKSRSKTARPTGSRAKRAKAKAAPKRRTRRSN